MAMLTSVDCSEGSLPLAACAAAEVFNSDVTFIWLFVLRAYCGVSLNACDFTVQVD